MVTFIFVTLCRKFDDKNDLDNEGDKAKELNKYNAENEEVFLVKIKIRYSNTCFICHFSDLQISYKDKFNNSFKSVENTQLDEKERDETKKKLLRIKQCKKMLMEIITNFIFIGILFTFIYSTKNTNSFYYASQIQNSFSGYQGVKNVQDLYKWLSSDFLTTLIEDPSEFNSSIRSTYANFDYYLNDAASFVIGYPILRQLRTVKSK